MTHTRTWLALAAVLLAPLGASAQTAGVHVVEPGETLFRISRSYGLTVERLRELNGLEGDAISVGQRLRVADGAPAQAGPPPRPMPQPAATPPRLPTAAPPAVAAAPPAVAAAAPAAGVHVVEPGESLFRIALRYDTTVDELRRLNGIEGDQIQVGQRLALGDGAAASTAAAPGGAVASGGAAVVPGGAAPVEPVRFGTARPWSVNETTVPADLVHFAEPGETLYSIAASLGLSVDELAAGNALTTAPLAPGTAVYLTRPVDPAEASRRALPPPFAEGLALVYPDVMAGRRTESGEPYDPEAFTASHREVPLGSVLLVTNPATGRSTFVRVTDRGPVSQSYLVELSAAAADVLGLDPDDADRVELRRIP
ncbi:LysM peptidoglycan-binding domain-containing protein [Rubrivirga sp. S365]|uniref:Probable endolytic peptidoglycan transglycosylase RlpA n=1 Tax=Rubrivirga litoralis TaxID=3075598 RepID=A0ABU3BRA7_9BACT|nr:MULTISPECIES: LysM peptidoglycan-binding domain-containing protein [unclassified Rubrivirga]MDT0631822.1 LysM peptidoglycan-binding domain-containing protein [Rubrivirga sp. F394]MDT7856486.1 LysM peptidoglycan-binding domain-containing protein [Rubrivirga sp. S365]